MSWTSATPTLDAPGAFDRPTASTAGVLRPAKTQCHAPVDRFAPADALRGWVERYWTVSWSLRPGESFVSSVLTHPAVNLSVESGAGPRHGFAMPAALLHGVVTRRFDITLTGEGRVFGVKFRPGGFAAFTGRPAAAWTDRVVRLSDIVGPDADRLRDAVLREADDGARAAVLDEFLLSRRPEPDERYERLLAIIAGMLDDRGLTSVAAVCERHGVEPRTLQRLFHRYVGVGPKWVLRRFRLHDAQLMLDDGWPDDLASLAATLGWFDQAHFTRDFRDAVGCPPGEYAAHGTARR